MQNRQRLDELKFKLLKKGLPKKYVRRVITELSEHGEDSRDGKSMSEYPEEIIGDVDKMAAVILERMKKSRFAGRHAIFSFAFLPVLIFATIVALLMVGVELIPDANFRDSEGFTPYAYAFYYCIKFALPVLLAGGFCFIARNAFCGFRWAFVACISLTVFLLSSQIDIRPPISGSPGTGTFMIGFGFPFGTLQSDLPLQEKVKCIVAYYKGFWQFTPLFLFGIFYFSLTVRRKSEIGIE